MSWSFDIPGQPFSVNHSYRPVRLPAKGGGTRIGLAKVAGLEAWQTSVAYITRSARPTGWSPEGQIRVEMDFFLRRDIDCDNMMKAMLDAVASALQIDDRRFLPCARSKTVGVQSERTTLTISEVGDDPGA